MEKFNAWRSEVTQESQQLEMDSNRTGNVAWNADLLLQEQYRHQTCACGGYICCSNAVKFSQYLWSSAVDPTLQMELEADSERVWNRLWTAVYSLVNSVAMNNADELCWWTMQSINNDFGFFQELRLWYQIDVGQRNFRVCGGHFVKLGINRIADLIWSRITIWILASPFGSINPWD